MRALLRLAPRARRCFSGSANGPLEEYLSLKAAGEIKPDPRQEVAMGKLDDLSKRLTGYSPKGAAARKPAPSAAPANGNGGGFFGGLFGGGSKPAPAPAAKAEPPRLVPQGPLGLYLWGGTGTGKTFMMDIFHDKVPVERKKRVHFHEWMIDVHERLHRRQKGSSGQKGTADDLVEQVAAEMLSEAWLLCFDEFQVTHISDAIILKRIFSVLFERGAVVVATSNRPPEDLYLNGLNRNLFLPFIPMLKDFCEVHPIGAEVDYRMVSVKDGEDDRVYLCPNGKEENKLLEYKFYRLCNKEVITGGQVEAQGRKIVVPKAARNSNVAWFPFKDLCDKALGAADYLAVGSAFHTIFMPDVPKLTLQERDQVRRFITFVDAMYERKVKLVISAAADPIQLFYVSEEDKRTSTFDEVFAWDRTVSRLMEMQSAKYLAEAARALDAEQFLGQYKLSALSDDDLVEMWRRYDADESNTLEMDELRLLLEDLLEKQMGHRNLTDEVFSACVETIDANRDGVISFEEFTTYLGDYYLVRSSMQL